MSWETVIGLEIHVQLNTESKIFSGASTTFGQAPNTQASAIDLGLPGTLPTPNEGAFKKAILFGLAIGADINRRSVFERKNYFYPDLPKGYQTTQLAEPIVKQGVVRIVLANGQQKDIRIHHAHLEEDAGKSLHEDFHGQSGIDLNRAGTPLIEIVSEPDMQSAEEAVAFAKALHETVVSLGICDGNMAQGSMRFDVNISIRPEGSDTLGTRTETKNLNSFKFMEDAIALEVSRQIDVLESGGTITQETRLYNGDTGVAKSMRSKEEANDYRYFPCPDLLPVIIDDDFIDAVKQSMPELPATRALRFTEDYQLNESDARLLSAQPATADFFEQMAQAVSPKTAANWMMGEVSAYLNHHDISIQQLPVTAQQLVTLIQRVDDGTLSSKTAKQVFLALAQSPAQTVDEIIDSQGLKQVSDTGAIEAIVSDVISNNPKQVENFRQASPDKQPKMLGFFVGQVMKASKGQANPKIVNEILNKQLKS